MNLSRLWQMNRITGLFVKGRQLANTLAECGDCISVLEREQSSQSVVNPAELSDEEFLNLFQKKEPIDRERKIWNL